MAISPELSVHENFAVFFQWEKRQGFFFSVVIKIAPSSNFVCLPERLWAKHRKHVCFSSLFKHYLECLSSMNSSQVSLNMFDSVCCHHLK